MVGKIYKMIDFKEEKQRKKRCVDFVPADWITYDHGLKNLATKFMPPPYTKETLSVLHDLIKSEASPPESWPKFRIDIIGEAKSYDSAMNKLKILEQEKYAFSTESEGHAKIKAVAVKKAYRLKKNPNHNKEVEKLLEVPSLSEQSDDSLDNQAQYSDKSSSSASSSSKQAIERTPINPGRTQDDNNNRPVQVARHTAEPLTPLPITESIRTATISEASSKSQPTNDDNLEIFGTRDIVIKAYHSHSLQLTRIQTTLTELKTILDSLVESRNNPEQATNQQLLTVDRPFAERHELTLPFSNLTDFHNFEEKLASDENLCTQLKRDIWYLVGPKSDLSRSISSVIKKYMSRAVVINFTAVKKCPGKEVFKLTTFYRCIKEAITKEYRKNHNSPIKDKTFDDAVGTVISNAKDWEGQRLFRMKRFYKENDSNEKSAEQQNK